jgi:hypothetical protein
LQGILEVLQRVAEDDHIESFIAEQLAQIYFFHVPDHDPFAMLLRLMRGFWVGLGPRYRAAALHEDSCKITGGAPDVEYALAAPNELDDQSMGVVGVLEVYLHFVLARHLPPRP